MKHFNFISAQSFDEAAEALAAKERSAAVAGGTDLLGALKDSILMDPPKTLVSLEDIKDTRYIRD